MMENKNILAKLHKILHDVPYIQKDGENTHQRYKYASERAIKERVHQKLDEHGVIFQISQDVPFVLGNVLIVPVQYTFYDVDSGESICGTFNGAGHLRDDKGYYAATTGAIKYILTSIFLIATGDDPEDDSDEEPEDGGKKSSKPDGPTQQQVEALRKIVQAEGYDDETKTKITELMTSGRMTKGQAGAYIGTFKAWQKMEGQADE